MKKHQRKGALTFIVTILVVLFAVVVMVVDYKSSSYSSYLASAGPILDKKEQVLNIVYSGKKLTPESREIIFENISGTKILQYNFSQEEKMEIIKFLNQ